MDRRTIKIRTLETKLESAREFIRLLVFTAAECGTKNHHLSNEYLIKEGVKKLEYICKT